MSAVQDREAYMRQALELAKEAAVRGEVPVGCVIVDAGGTVVGQGRNRREETRSALSHAECEAIAAACRRRGDWRLEDCTLYVTLEPCPMCAGAILSARIGTVVYGARDEVMGSCGSVLNLFEERYGHHPAIYGGVLETECAAVLTDFFDKLRK
jgi:tRNA(adenine34) deaminase